MAVREANLLLSDAAQPANGVDYDNVHIHYGGPIAAVAEGEFGGATVELVFCTKLPAGGDRADYSDNPGDYIWISLYTFDANERMNLDNLNPCAIGAKVNGSAVTTRVKLQFG